MTYSLINDGFIPIQNLDGHIVRATLPEILDTLSNSDIKSFPGLSAHQRQPWFHFLVQVAHLATERNGVSGIPAGAKEWRKLLLSLAPDSAWSLVNANVEDAAFMQPPIPEGSISAFKPIADTPDGIDVLITSKNHDVKMARISDADPHHWLYSLITLQTQQGFFGRGNYGTSRMNGGFGSRVLVDLIPSLRWGDRFRRGVKVAAAARSGLLDGPYGFSTEGDLALVWLESWDGKDSLSLDQLDPFYIEVCRRVRLSEGESGRLSAYGKPTDASRIAAKELKGVVGDIWTPVKTKEASSFTVAPGGFQYGMVADLLTNKDMELPPSLKEMPGDPKEGMFLHLCVLVRGQGVTDGLYERVLPVSTPRIRKLSASKDRAAAHEIAKSMIQDCKDAKKSLRVALLVLIQGGPAEINFKDERVRDPNEALDREIDAIFFDWMWKIVDAAGSDEVRREWQRALYRISLDCFNEWSTRLPAPSARRELAFAKAQISFFRTIYSHLVLLKEKAEEAETDSETISDVVPA